jgi:hypothetical protein
LEGVKTIAFWWLRIGQCDGATIFRLIVLFRLPKSGRILSELDRDFREKIAGETIELIHGDVEDTEKKSVFPVARAPPPAHAMNFRPVILTAIGL